MLPYVQMRWLVVVALVGTSAFAQPADTARAKELYLSAEAAMAAQDYETAARDYGAAYEISKDPVLFYKIGTANERAGKCSVAVIYYRRYLAAGKPTPAFVDITNARIKACEPATADKPPEPVRPVEPTKPEPTKPEPTKPEPAKPEPTKPEPTKPVEPTPLDPEPAKEDPKTAMGAFVGARDTGEKKPALTARNRSAWLFVTGSIALVTVGAVLAYSADSAENDINDLYVGFGGSPPVYDRETKRLYEEMIAEGERYQTLSWISFGLAGATAGVAAFLFWREARAEKPQAVVAPAVTEDGAGVRAIFTF